MMLLRTFIDRTDGTETRGVDFLFRGKTPMRQVHAEIGAFGERHLRSYELRPLRGNLGR